MTQIPIDPDLRAAVLAELARADDHVMSDEDLADAIIRAINRTVYLKTVQQTAKHYAEMSKPLPNRKTSFAMTTLDNCCCAWADHVDQVGTPTYVCRRCIIHEQTVTSKLMCFNHRKQERTLT